MSEKKKMLGSEYPCNPFQSDIVPTVMTKQRSQVNFCFKYPLLQKYYTVWYDLRTQYMYLHYLQVDSDEDGRQSKMGANSKSYEMAYKLELMLILLPSGRWHTVCWG